jgi:hypothetical protein
MTWGYVAVGVGTLAAGALSGDSAKSGAAEQGTATRAAIGEQQRELNVTRTDQAPYRAAGTGSLLSLADLLGVPGVGSQKQKYIAGGQSTTGTNIGRDQFNGEAYLSANPDVAAAGLDPFPALRAVRPERGPHLRGRRPERRAAFHGNRSPTSGTTRWCSSATSPGSTSARRR